MDQKVALLTGAGRGIGLAIARAFVAQGAAVAIQDIDEDVAVREAEQIRKDGGRAVALGGDVTDGSLPPRLVQQTVEQLGGLHVLVNNAAIQSYADWATLGEDVIEKQLRGNVVAPILMCQQAVPIFRRQHFGRILNIGSIQQTTGNPKMLPYSLSKAALEKMTTALAIDLAKDNITVNCIAPATSTPTATASSSRRPRSWSERASRSCHWAGSAGPKISRGWRCCCAARRGSTSPGRACWWTGG